MSCFPVFSLLALASFGALTGCSDIIQSLPGDVPETVSGVPTDRAALARCLDTGVPFLDGRCFAAFSAAEQPHGSVRVFFNPTIETSLHQDRVPRPAGSVRVKEIGRGATVEGYSAMLKVRDGSAASDWLFYEAFGGSVSTYKPGRHGLHGLSPARKGLRPLTATLTCGPVWS